MEINIKSLDWNQVTTTDIQKMTAMIKEQNKIQEVSSALSEQLRMKNYKLRQKKLLKDIFSN